jgi:hypothetical protein
MSPQYHFSWTIILALISAAVKRETRSFRTDSEYLITKIFPPVVFMGSNRIPCVKPILLTVNHYSRPGFSIMWVVIAISAYIPVDIHWIMTNAWEYPTYIQNIVFKPLSHFILSKIARIYGFTSMPPLPPSVDDQENSVISIRNLFEFIRSTKIPVIGMAPEGRDMPSGVLGNPARGTGKLIQELSKKGFLFVPVGAYEEDGALHIAIGDPYELIMPGEINPSEYDVYVSQMVMRKIAKLIPVRLRGNFT